MNLKNFPKILWIFIIGIVVGLFMSSNSLINFLMNLIIRGNFDSFQMWGVFKNFFTGFFYILIPLFFLLSLLEKNATKVKIIGSTIILLVFIFTLSFLNCATLNPLEQLNPGGPNCNKALQCATHGTCPTYIIEYIIGIAFLVLVGYFIGSSVGKIKSKMSSNSFR